MLLLYIVYIQWLAKGISPLRVIEILKDLYPYFYNEYLVPQTYAVVFTKAI